MADRAEIAVVYRRELLEAFRDKRTLYAMVLLPILTYPILVAGSGHLWRRQEKRLQSQVLRVGVAGDPTPLARVAGRDTLLRFANVSEEAVKAGAADVWVSLPAGLATGSDSAMVRIVYDGTSERSTHARERVEGLLDTLRAELLAERAEATGLDIEPGALLSCEERNVATSQRMTGARLGSVVPFLLIIFLFSSGSYAALDAFAGERERGTLETLLSTPAARESIVAGKFLAVLSVNLGAALLNLLSLVATLTISPLAASFGGQVRPALTGGAFPLLLLLAIPLAVLATAILIVVASSARTFREGQYLTFPILMACLVPAMAGNFPGIEDVWPVYFLPIANVAIVARQILLGEFVAWRIISAVVVTSLIALVAVSRASRVLSSERALGSGSTESPLAAETAGRVRAALFFVAVDFLLFFHVGSLLQARALYPGLLLSLFLLLLFPALVFLKILGLPVARTVHLTIPPLGVLVGSALLAPALALLAEGSFQVVSTVLPVPEVFLEFFEALMNKERHGALATYLVLAVSPGICEEFVFRGVVYGILSRAWGARRAVIVAAVLFAAFHLSVYRFVPVFVVGLALGTLVWRTGSLVPAMLLHATYNALNVAVAREEIPALALAPRVALAALLAAAGAFLILRATGRNRTPI
jgi:ABC-type Na+ efflux pump permease subunit/membrane protease YdiL (CAAX protease family)